MAIDAIFRIGFVYIVIGEVGNAGDCRAAGCCGSSRTVSSHMAFCTCIEQAVVIGPISASHVTFAFKLIPAFDICAKKNSAYREIVNISKGIGASGRSNF